MIPLALGLALAAAFLHAGWNVLLKTSPDPLDLSARAVAIGMVVMTPVALVAWLVLGRPGLSGHVLVLAIVSSLAELVYFILLSAAYQRGELSTVYPVARGTSPVLAVLAGLIILREHLSLAELAGVCLLLAGIWLVQRPATASRAAVILAVLTGVFIATYSTIDTAGVRAAAPWLYAWLIGTFTALILAAWVWPLDRGRVFLPSGLQTLAKSAGEEIVTRVSNRQAAVVGTLMAVAYLLVLLALSIAPLTIVAPFRESAIVLVTGWGIWRLKEREGAWQRVAGAAGIVGGAVILILPFSQ